MILRSYLRRLGVLVTIAAAVWVVNSNAAPSPFAPDALLETQWHLKSRSLETGGVNVRDAWPVSQGAGVVIGIVDDGIQYSHPDLSPNYLASASYDFNFSDTDPQPFATAGRGTAVAGLAAARGDNTIGVSGVAPQASIAGLRLTAAVATDAQEAAAFGFQPDVIDILNNSWNPTDNGTTLKAPGALAAAARQSAATTGRQGKGRIFVWSSGNGRLLADDCNFDGYANNRFAMAVGATNDAGNLVTTSEGCSALMVMAPSGGGSRSLTTTDLLGSNGYDASDYTSAYGASANGAMSAAAPTVSGAAALMLARNSSLTWRDVQTIIRNSSVRIFPADASWTIGAFPHNEKYGFGLLDAAAAVDMAGTWTNVPAEEALLPATRTLNQAIPDINATGISDTITISGVESNFVVEHVEVEFNATHTWRGDIQVKLTSPSGVVSNLATVRPSDNGDNFTNWKFGSVRHWGQTAAGVWTLNVADRRFQDTGTWNNWTLRIYGYHTAAAAPAAFVKSSPANGATGVSMSPTLSWSASAGATSYEYCYDQTNDGVCGTWTSTGTNTSVALSGLSAGAAYYWQARAVNATGVTYAQGSAGASWSFLTNSPPGAFLHSSPANGATGQSLNPTLSWTASSGATSYEYCYDTSNNSTCNSSWVSVGGATSVGLSGLSAGTPYYWHVRANNASATTYADGASTTFWSFTPMAAPGAFTHSSPANGATAQSMTPTLSWSASSGAMSYEYCYDATNDGACTTWINIGASTSTGLSGLNSGTPYYWQVRAVGTGGTTYAEGSASSFWTFTPLALPGAFSHSSPSNNATGQSLNPTLDWNNSAGANSYEYCYDATNDGSCTGWTGTGVNTSAALTNLTPNTTYFWQVRATNTSGTTYAEGVAGIFWSFTTLPAPGAFNTISPSNGANGLSANPTLSWGTSTTAASYQYCIDTTNDNACSGWTSTGTSTSVGLSGLSAGTTYFWHVRAINASGTTFAAGNSTAFVNFTTQVNPPAAFGHSSPSNGVTGHTNSPTLTWSASAGATTFEYCIDTTNDNACSGWTSTGTNTSVALSNLAANTAHYWQVRAVNPGGTTYAEGAASSFWTFTTQVALPAAFGRTSPANGATNQSKNPTLTWSASAGATGYQYCIDTTNDNGCASWTSTGTNTSVALTGLTAGTAYFWHVRASNVGGTTYADGNGSPYWSFTTVAAPGEFAKASPANAATGLPTSVTVNWSASAGATGYEVCFDTTDDGACSGWSSTGTSTSANLNGLNAGTAYYWHVRATNAGGMIYAESQANHFWMLTTALGMPGAFGHSSPANNAVKMFTTVTLSWTPSTTATSYEYCIDNSNNSACNATWTSTGASTSAAVSGLKAGTSYFWHVRAINASGTTYAEASTSAFWSFTTKTKARVMVDLNGDGNGDAFTYNPTTGAWARQVSQVDGGFSTVLGNWAPGWTVTPVNFNADTLTDFFLFNASTGQWSKVINNGTGFTTQFSGGWWSGWERFVMDLDGDGISDLFLYDGSTGQWFKAISTPAGFDYVQGGWNPGWEIYPMTLNGDSIDDMFLINRTTGRWFWVTGQVGGGFNYPATEAWFSGWSIYPGDFNGDLLTDVLLHDPATGTYFVATATESGFTYQQGGWSLGWSVMVADFDADGADDLFLHDPSTGVWFEMVSNGAGNFVNGGGDAWSLGWKVHPTDLNGDGRTDIVLYHPSTGAWYQARNVGPGQFAYGGGAWDAGLTIVVRPPIR